MYHIVKESKNTFSTDLIILQASQHKIKFNCSVNNISTNVHYQPSSLLPEFFLYPCPAALKAFIFIRLFLIWRPADVSQRCCVRQSRPPAGVLWSRTVQRSWPLHDDWPAAGWACMNSMLLSRFWTVVVLVVFFRSFPISRSALAPQPSTAAASCHFSSPSCLRSCLARWLLLKICGRHMQRPCSVCFIYCKMRLREPLKKKQHKSMN